MAIKSYRPTSPARRQMTGTDYSGLSKKAPEKSLLKVKKKNSGRNTQGKITVRHRGGGNRQKYRVIDWNAINLISLRTSRPLNTTRTARHLSRCSTMWTAKSVILSPNGLKSEIRSCPAMARHRDRQLSPLSRIPVGTQIHNIEMSPGHGQLVRAAGTWLNCSPKKDATRRFVCRPAKCGWCFKVSRCHR